MAACLLSGVFVHLCGCVFVQVCVCVCSFRCVYVFVYVFVGSKEDRDGLHPVTQLSNLLANRQAPKTLSPFLGLLLLSLFTNVEEDARRVCSGDVWRRAVAKALFRSGEDTLNERLEPHQLAVSVRSSSEVMAHLARG